MYLYYKMRNTDTTMQKLTHAPTTYEIHCTQYKIEPFAKHMQIIQQQKTLIRILQSG